jgi:isopentenyldiphosphate isomerase
MAQPDELVTIVDEKDQFLSSKNFTELNNDDRWRIVCIWITDNRGRILIAKRSIHKKIEPERWGPGVAGTVTYPDSYELTAKRELKEELGITTDDLKILDVIFFRAAFGKRACALINAVLPSDTKFILQDDEVAEVRWVEREYLMRDHEKNPSKYTKNFGEIMGYFIEK